MEILRLFGGKISRAEEEKLFSKVDTDGSGQIDMKEFWAMMTMKLGRRVVPVCVILSAFASAGLSLFDAYVAVYHHNPCLSYFQFKRCRLFIRGL